ncbi:MAG: hypothetical protein WCL51_07245 [Bacteroidota bacterium]
MSEEINVCLGIEGSSPSAVTTYMRNTNTKAIENPEDIALLPHKDAEVTPLLDSIDLYHAKSSGGDRAATKKVATLVKQARLFNRENATFVQKVARTKDDPSFPILLGYKMFKRRKTTKSSDFELTQMGSGEVKAKVKTLKAANGYVWMYFEDGKWIYAMATRKGTYIFKGLNPLTVYKFRYAHVLNPEQGKWIESAEITVI